MIENRTAGQQRKKRRHNLLSSDGPFPVDHNIFQFFAGGGRGEMLSYLTQRVQNCDDPTMVFGEAGSGKTFLSLVLADQLQHKFRVIRYDLPSVTRESLLRYIARDFKIGKPSAAGSLSDIPFDSIDADDLDPEGNDTPSRSKFDELLTSSQSTPTVAELIKLAKSKGKATQPVLLIIDSNADINTQAIALLEQLNKTKYAGMPLFSVVIFKTTTPIAYVRQESELSRTEQIVNGSSSTRYLRRLSLSEIHEYLEHHMMLYDYSQRHMFDREMSYFIADRSEGVIGRINDIARSAFLLAGINNGNKVSLSHLVAISSSQKTHSTRSRRLKLIKSSASKIALIGTAIAVFGLVALMFVTS